jgi:hypothetical protein
MFESSPVAVKSDLYLISFYFVRMKYRLQGRNSCWKQRLGRNVNSRLLDTHIKTRGAWERERERERERDGDRE